MRVTVCELPDDRKDFETAWLELTAYVSKQQSDLVLLPELPFYPWIATTPQFDVQVWQRAQKAHEVMMQCLRELSASVVLGTHPVLEGGLRLNRGFYWTPADGSRGVHDKYYLPNEKGFYERCWFDRGRREFTLARVQEMAIASGAFVLSSNRSQDHVFGGRGLVVGPDGDVLASTSRQAPFATVEIDLAESAQAKKTYPRDLPEWHLDHCILA
jgi:predicted amidohydrolase